MDRLSEEQIEAVIQEAKERCPYYGEPDGCNAHGGPLMCCDELDEVGEVAKAACALGTVEELTALVKARDEGPCGLCRYNPPSSCDGKPCTMCPAEAALE